MELPAIEQVRPAALLGALALLWVLEELWPLRRRTQPKLKRAAINLGLAAIAAAATRAAFFPLVLMASSDAAGRGWGLLPALGLSGPSATLAALLLLDYTLYLWHLANHRWDFFWRFHAVHHADLDMDVTTASRFHPGELALSSVYRAAQAVAFGVGPGTIALFETLVTLSAQFHHANVRLPFGLERVLGRFLVTPRMHGVHHSIVKRETDSNFSATINFWDRLHGTLRLNVPQDEITIGVPAYRDPARLSFWRSLVALPVENPPWRLPEGGEPQRRELATPVWEPVA